MAPLYATGIVIESAGKSLVVTFENTSKMTTVRISKAAALKLARQLADAAVEG
jgi:hypothetical protein